MKELILGRSAPAVDRRCSENRPRTSVNIAHRIGFPGLQIERDHLAVCQGKAVGEASDHLSKRIKLPVNLDQGTKLQVGLGKKRCGSGEGVDLVQSRRNPYMRYGRRILRGINRVRIESCIELSAHTVETVIAEIESAVIVVGERDVWVGRHSGRGNGRRDTRLTIDGVDVVAEIGQI